MMINKILMVCLGNICRSPMAEGWFKHNLKGKVAVNNEPFYIASAGIEGVVGWSATEHAQKVMLKHGVDISQHRARQLNDYMINEYELILVMEERQKKHIEKIFPHSRGKVHLLGRWSDFEVADPYELGENAFEECFDLIHQGWLDWSSRFDIK